MIRCWISLGLLVLVLALSFWGLFAIAEVRDQVSAQAAELQAAVGIVSPECLGDMAAQFAQSWEPQEHLLIRFVRHAEIDELSRSISRLEMLARYNDIGEFSAEIARIDRLMRHILETEYPYPRNVLRAGG